MVAIFFILGHTLFSTLANICFKSSSVSDTVIIFLIWQVAGNASAFLGSLSYSFSLRYLPLHIAFPVTQGLAVLGVTILGASLVFHERVLIHQWLGIFLIVSGIVLMSYQANQRADDREIRSGM